MSKRIKNLIEQETKAKLDGRSDFMVISLFGMSGNDNNNFRTELVKKDISVSVVKNTLAVRALKALGKENTDDLFSGPCAIAVGGEDIVSLAKEIVKWEKELDKLEVKGAFVEGQLLDSAGAKALSKMLSRAEQQGVVVQLAMSPATTLAGAVVGPASTIAGCIKTIIDNGEDAA